jgi:large subunit ribosomal protein L28
MLSAAMCASRVSTNAIKSVDHNGGLVLKARPAVLSPRVLELKRAIEKRKAGEPMAKASLRI